MTTETFLKWLQHFISFTKRSAADPVSLVIDGHGSHKELDVITFAHENHAHVLTQPTSRSLLTDPLYNLSRTTTVLLVVGG
ncbi:hypothetical protein AVEN_274248-1 [Araneus ventricosus]|uniref:DDE-1 domain-containing protein n=1 Tax=Araneus ventricosus TaxID=182803 RepID=A0A4Y2GYZ7_ARAVE|nr:hypothetical protein AVEN_274248-1 [Araneus ventricosus]